jgi:precorrin-2 dehydrogenase/sirohydrochlorin ferrochelatase
MPVDGPQYPVNLIVEGRRCLVVGGGSVALRKVDGLVACGAVVHVVGLSVSPAVRAVPVTWEERPYRRGEAADYRLVIAATDSAEVNRAVFEDSEAAGVWVNAADDPTSCSFTLPSVVRRGPIMVTVATGGQSPAVAAWLKDRFEAELGPEFEVLLGLVAGARESVRRSGRSTESLDWKKALNSDMLDLIRAGQIVRARERLQACLSSS